MDALLAWFETAPLAALGPERRPGAWTVEECTRRIDDLGLPADLDERRLRCLRGLLWLWSDHLDEAHVEVQNLPGADAAFVHGIMHRREPDAGNSRYWFHRVGAHPVFETLGELAAPVLAADTDLARRLIRGGTWDPMAFVGAVDSVLDRAETPATRVLQELQRLEMRTLALHLAGAGAGRGPVS